MTLTLKNTSWATPELDGMQPLKSTKNGDEPARGPLPTLAPSVPDPTLDFKRTEGGFVLTSGVALRSTWITDRLLYRLWVNKRPFRLCLLPGAILLLLFVARARTPAQKNAVYQAGFIFAHATLVVILLIYLPTRQGAIAAGLLLGGRVAVTALGLDRRLLLPGLSVLRELRGLLGHRRPRAETSGRGSG